MDYQAALRTPHHVCTNSPLQRVKSSVSRLYLGKLTNMKTELCQVVYTKPCGFALGETQHEPQAAS